MSCHELETSPYCRKMLNLYQASTSINVFLRHRVLLEDIAECKSFCFELWTRYVLEESYKKNDRNQMYKCSQNNVCAQKHSANQQPHMTSILWGGIFIHILDSCQILKIMYMPHSFDLKVSALKQLQLDLLHMQCIEFIGRSIVMWTSMS